VSDAAQSSTADVDVDRIMDRLTSAGTRVLAGACVTNSFRASEKGKLNVSRLQPGKFHDRAGRDRQGFQIRVFCRSMAQAAASPRPRGLSHPAMWTPAKSDLKLRLTMRVVAASAACFAAASAYVVLDGEQSARARIDGVAGLVAKDLQLQRGKMNWISDPSAAFPDLQNIATSLMAPGLCIGYRTNSGDVLQRFCSGARNEASPPAAFATLYRRLFDPGRAAVRSVSFNGEKVGEALAWVDPATLAAEVWHGASRLLAVMAVTLLVLCGLVYATLARALRPARLICAGLERIAANDLSTRLPPFDLAELSAICNVFNHLAESLERTLSERRELTRRLIALQDDERRHLARELHDEFGQCLAAIRALAASASQTAAQDCPGILSDCETIERTAARMTETLRGSLFRLRPPDVDELGLAASLEGLVAGWNGRSLGRARFEIRLSGSFEDLPPSFSASLYRIAQEALTNAAKHADATRVVLRLAKSEALPVSGRGSTMEVELTVDDDGQAGEADPAAKPGMGFLGMRERVATLGGRLSFAAGQKNGSVLRVVIPVTPVAAGGLTGLEEECPA
jgi:signal transduction histidine kinase